MDRWHRRSVRLAGYDYAQPGAYFVTICTQGRECIFGSVRGASVDLSLQGDIVWRAWDALPEHYAHVKLDAFVVMPNHVHGIILLKEALEISVGPGSGFVRSERHGLPEIVRAVKSFAARRINELSATPGARVWRRNY